MTEAATEATQEAAPQEQAAESTTESLLDSGPSESPDDGYFLIEGIKGSGDVPDWYKADKYKSVAEQARAYTELEKKFGSFTGAPKDGYKLPEGLESDDALVQEVIKFGTETNLNQGGFEKLMELALANDQATQEVNREAEMQKLGPNASQRIKQLEVFLQDKAGDNYDEIKDMLYSADQIMLAEALMKSMQPAKLPIDGHVVDGLPTWADIEAEMFKKAEDGRLLRSVSPEHEAKIQEMMKAYGGDKEHHVVVG